MAIDYGNSNGCGSCNSGCIDTLGCHPDRTPDFVIRRHDTRPPFKVLVQECDGPMDIRGLVVEVNMWALGNLKKSIEADTEYFALADNVGFSQVMLDDIIVMDRARTPEYMLVTGFDEDNNLIRVQRGYRGTTPGRWKRGAKLRIFRILNGVGQTELTYEDIREVDGTVQRGVLTQANLLYEFQPEDTCLPGCYWMEFKMLKMKDITLFLPGGNWVGPIYLHDDGYQYTGDAKTESSVRLSYDSINDRYLIPSDQWTGDSHFYSGDFYTGTEQNSGSVWLDRTDKPFEADREQMEIPSEDLTLSILSCASVTPSFTPASVTSEFDPTVYGCWLGADVEWTRRLPIDGEGFLIKIADSPTKEV